MNGCKESIALMNALLEKSSEKKYHCVYVYTGSDIFRSAWDWIHHGMDPLCLHRTGWKQEQHDSILYHLHKWTHLVPDSRFDLYWIKRAHVNTRLVCTNFIPVPKRSVTL